MFENLGRFFKRMVGTETKELDVASKESKETAKERLHLVLMQDRANVSADFLELMKQEIIDVIKKYIEVDEETIDVRLTTKTNEDGTNGTPALYANIPILNIRNDMKVENYNFELVSDGSIIAHKIEEPVIEETVVEEKIDSLISENLESNENTFVENVSEFDSETMDSTDFSKIEERKENIVNEIIPAIENIVQNEVEDKISDNEFTEVSLEKDIKPELNKTEIDIDVNKKTEENIQEENKQEENIQEEKQIIEEKLNVEDNELEDEVKSEIQENTQEENSVDSEELTIEAVQQLKKSCKRGRPKKKEKKKSDKKVNKSSVTTEVSEEDDDDVTFDDLLKKAEEEDRRIAEQEKKEVK
ncbi:MAG: cell division topological specificity factor MinE [Clostridia bacterium]|nr:cell division topological specificity factor MinE [Clostridia bacterium]MBP3597803.1 cell division topological specificity factor MinE [Clostridia bacterium]